MSLWQWILVYFIGSLVLAIGIGKWLKYGRKQQFPDGWDDEWTD